MATQMTIQTIKDFVTKSFIENGKSLDAVAISQGTGLSVGVVRRVMSDCWG